MQVVYERCCGLDVHKKTVVACAMTPEGKEVRTFGTMTAEIRALATWLKEKQISVVAMESTGVFWKPIYNLLEAGGAELLVVNAQHPQRVPGAELRPAEEAVPGRKTDVKDAEWIADLLRHGLLRGSFIPDRAQRELRELVAYRCSLVEERAREANRIQKVLEGANIKLAAVLHDVLGQSGRCILEAIVRGEEDAGQLAGEAKTRIKASRAQLEAALEGVLGPHQRLLLAEQLRHVDFLTEAIERVSSEIEERLRPFQEAVERLDRIPGVGVRTAQAIVAIIGTDMSRFPTHRHLASWAKLCPGLKESAGKRSPVGTGKGNPYLRTALIEAAKAAGRTKNTYLASQYHRLAAKRGKNRAAVAVAHTILVIIYHMLKEGTPYSELGAGYFDQRDKEQVIRRAVRRIEALGKHVTLEDAA